MRSKFDLKLKKLIDKIMKDQQNRGALLPSTKLGPGVWSSEFGVWSLGFGITDMGSGV